MTKSKFLVLHPDPENLDAIVRKANAQNAKNGPFDAVVLVGPCVSPTSTTPSAEMPIYYFGNTQKESTFVEETPNFVCVQTPSAVTKLPSGVTLGFLAENAKVSDLPTKVDILFSYHWPNAVARTQRLSLVADRSLDPVVHAAQPRYHFAVGSEQGRHYEHPFFAWSPTRTGRFFSLAKEGSGNKWFYAFAIDTAEDNAADAGLNPYESQTRENDAEGDTDSLKRPREQGLPSQKALLEQDRKRAKVVAPSQCFFCLSNPNVETHMIASIGTQSYLTVAKGPLTQASKDMPFSGHTIIIPISHEPTLAADSAASEEIDEFKNSLVSAFRTTGHGVVFFEISRPENVHYHVQAVPVLLADALALFDRALNEKVRANNDFHRNQALNFEKYTEETDTVRLVLDSGSFIRFKVCADLVVEYIAPIDGSGQVDLQFPRRVLAYMLRIPKRIRWDKCKQSMGQERDECELFKVFYERAKLA